MLFCKRSYFFFAVLLNSFFVFGCSEPIRTLQGLGAEKDAQEAQVGRQKADFKLLRKDIENKRLQKGAKREQIIARYGRPVLDTVPGFEKGKAFLYRNPTDFFDTTKVYLIFDENNCLKKIEIEDPDGK